VKRKHYLICPTRSSFFFTPVHGITWEHVQRQPTFEVLWPRIRHLLLGADFIASHSASFDRRVLESCCRAAMVSPPEIRYVCTVRLARRVWDIRPTSLSNVCTYLGLSLNHHDALSDAEACAGIVLAGLELKFEATIDRCRVGNGGSWRAPWKGGAFRWVQVPPGNRSSRKQPEQSWRQRSG
jgi:DNA polymerase-3 subunit epsilon